MSIIESVEGTTLFEMLIGHDEYHFYGVDCHCFCIGYPNSDKVVIFEAIENEDAGYWSYLKTIEVKFDKHVFFRQPIATVKLTKHFLVSKSYYYLTDVLDEHIWLKFGTDNSDDYYPIFVFDYEPKI